ncbi:MAG: AbrB/MazE/SpoVT family DNA-binding domain-containing protein [Leptolinea sp.]
MQRRLFKTGNSVVLSIPREMLESLGITDGDTISLTMEPEKHCIVITPVEKPRVAVSVDEDFARHVAEFIEEYRPALDELAK